MEIFWIILSSFWTLYDAAMVMIYHNQGNTHQMVLNIAMGICWFVLGIFWIVEYNRRKAEEKITTYIKTINDGKDLEEFVAEIYKLMTDELDEDEGDE